MPPKRINSDKPDRWKGDVAASVDRFNVWFMRFAPKTFRESRAKTTIQVEEALVAMRDLRQLDVDTLNANPAALPSLRMCCAPPLAVDRLVGLARVKSSLVKRLEQGKVPTRIKPEALASQLASICGVLAQMLDRDIFPWLESGQAPTERERERAATIVADRLCGAVANPIFRNAQEQRQLALIAEYLEQRGYVRQPPPVGMPLTQMRAGTYSIRTIVEVGTTLRVNIPIDVVIQPKKSRKDRLPILIEAKSAGDFANTNKRRKEEATKIHQLRETYGEEIQFILFLCGYFGTDYLGYEAAEGIDWVWEHRIDDLAKLGI